MCDHLLPSPLCRDSHYSYLLYYRTHFLSDTEDHKKATQYPSPPCMGHLHCTGPCMLAQINTLSVFNVYCSSLEVLTTKMNRRFTLTLRRGSAEQEPNTYEQQCTYQDLVLMNIYLTHNTQPHTKHTHTEHATQGTVIYDICDMRTVHNGIH